MTDNLKNQLDSFIIIKQKSKRIFLQKKDILYIKSEGNYTTIELRNKENYKLSYCLSAIYERYFYEKQFYRINQSYIINLSNLKEIQKDKIIFNNNQFIETFISKKYGKELLDIIS